MGVAKVLATKDADGAASKEEKAQIKRLERIVYEQSLVPMAAVRYVQDEPKAPRLQELFLSWPGDVLKKFVKLKEMYFFCWSHNWLDSETFHPRTKFLSLEDTYEYLHGEGKAPVLTVDVVGPYDPDAFDDQYLPVSPYDDLEQAKRVLQMLKDTSSQTGPAYLWHAHLIK